MFDHLPRHLVPRVLFLLKGMDAHGLWRTVWVCDALTQHGFIADWVLLDNVEQVEHYIASRRYNLVVTPRLIMLEAAKQIPYMLERVRADGMKWVYECDDEIFSPAIVEHQLAAFEVCRQAGRDQLELERMQRIAAIRSVDAVIVSTSALARVARTYTQVPVYVVPNAIDLTWMTQRIRSAEPRRLPSPVVGWAGGSRRDTDLEAVAEAWARIARRYPEVTFLVFGERMQILMDAIPKGQRRRVYAPWVDLDAFPKGLVEFDIACCSVAPTDWNTCKSPDKWYEFASAMVPCVVSPTLYGPYVTDGQDALVASTADEWEAAISRLLDDPDLRQQIALRALARVAREYSLQARWPRWVSVLSDVLAQSNGPFLEPMQSNAHARALVPV